MIFKSINGLRYSYDLRLNKIRSTSPATSENVCENSATRGLIKLPFDTSMVKKLAIYNIPYLSITITETCNMRCKYCIYSGKFDGPRVHNERSMTPENGIRIIDWFYAHSKNIPEVRIGFYGGEVLVNYSTLKKLTAYAQKKFDKRLKNIYFTTNGTLLNDDVRNWIAQNPILCVAVTLNGTSEIHDRNRVFISGEATHNLIMTNILALSKLLGDSFPKQVSFLANFKDFRERMEILKYFETDDILKKTSVLCSPIDYPTGMKEGQDRILTYEEDEKFHSQMEIDAIKKKADDTNEIYEKRLVKAGIKPDMLLKYHRRKEGVADNIYFPGGCIPFANRLAVDINGDLHFCEATDFLSPIGNVFRNEIYIENLEKLQEIEQLFNERLKCANCVAINFCELCFRDFLQKDGIRRANEINEACCNMRKKFAHDMAIYVSILEENPGYLNSLIGDSRNENVRKLIRDVTKRKSYQKEVR